ncbi:hypothetical protein [Sandaracinus amylolyticus]|uniref:hypothetical protein n=1 Tax=Sandaracinus amylolyticus TaxID=927083 RepID=UPI001F43075B|nr:hypothetical protein [Sandaracinus amylolyticus]UJR81467.1 Hypothetical protein I5071_35260 [Sandaracinus amylolyticus]
MSELTLIDFEALYDGGDELFMLGAESAWCAVASRPGVLASDILARLTRPPRSVPPTMRSTLERARSAPSSTIDQSKLAWLARKADRDGVCVVAGVPVDRRFVIHAMGLAKGHGDASVEVAQMAVASLGLGHPVLVVRGALWTLMVAPLARAGEGFSA